MVCLLQHFRSARPLVVIPPSVSSSPLPPDSPPDAATALRVMTLLRGVASRGTTVLCSLHQPRPRVMKLLDKVMLLSSGRVAYFGSPGDAEPFFRSVGRPFPASQPHPADAMLTLCCREDGHDLPSLFRRSGLFSSDMWSAGGAVVADTQQQQHGEQKDDNWRRVATARTAVASSSRQAQLSSGGGSGGGGGVEAEYRSSGEDDIFDEERELVGVGTGREGTGVRVGAGGSGSGSGSGLSGPRSGGARSTRRGQRRQQRQSLRSALATKHGDDEHMAPFFVQVEALSRRLLLRAVRHPLLLVLHFGGSMAMALCLASVFGGRLGFNLAGAQDR